ncbi:MAG: nucleotide pyrophosphohydrolase [Candidatus Hydrogenedentes bacterium]|nr:nucleotide pyrophosphohydrolase [Candidatus Hydrogenedentota bacterium]
MPIEDLPHIESAPGTEAEWFQALMNLARYLRSPEGCPWDQKQTALNFARFAAEETQELLEAFAEEGNSEIEEEFGDALFCFLASAAAAEEEGRFTMQNALQRIHEKMIRRHDHVFGENKAATPEEAMKSWEQIKAQEKNNR